MNVSRILIAVLLVAPAARSEDDPAALDRQALQGAWAVTKMVADGTELSREGALVVFSPSAMTLASAGKAQAWPLLFTLNPARTPKEIDFSPGPNSKAPAVPGIYQFTADGLVLCVAQGEPGRRVRPTSFEAKAGSKDLLLHLKRP